MCKVLQLFWPGKLEENQINPEVFFERYVNAYTSISITENYKIGSRILDISKYLFEEEEGRRNRIETTASNFLNVITVTAALVIGLAGYIFSDGLQKLGLFRILILAGFGMSLIYLCAAAIHALKVFSECPRYYIDPTDIVPGNNEIDEQYSIRLGKKFLEYTVKNYKINNRQMNIIHTARAFLRNAVFAILISGLFFGTQSVFFGSRYELNAFGGLLLYTLHGIVITPRTSDFWHIPFIIFLVKFGHPDSCINDCLVDQKLSSTY